MNNHVILPRVAPQQTFFPQTPKEVCDQIGLQWFAALRLHADGYFCPSILRRPWRWTRAKMRSCRSGLQTLDEMFTEAQAAYGDEGKERKTEHSDG